MGGVDKCDMMLFLYRIRMKSKKWYRHLIFHMVDLCCSNAWHLDKAVKGERSKYYKFKLAIAQCLVQGDPNPQPMLREHVDQILPDVRSARHVPDHVRSARHVPDHVRSARHVPDHVRSARHVPDHVRSARHVPDHVRSARHVPDHVRSARHVPDHVRSARHVPDHVRSARHVPDHVRLDGVNHLPKKVAKVPKKC